MPYKTEKLKLDCPFLDRRTKLLPCQRQMVRWWYDQGTSITQIAKMFKVNKRLIQFELFPERKKKNLEHRQDRGGWKAYYKGGKEWADAMKDHRKYKNKLLK